MPSLFFCASSLSHRVSGPCCGNLFQKRPYMSRKARYLDVSLGELQPIRARDTRGNTTVWDHLSGDDPSTQGRRFGLGIDRTVLRMKACVRRVHKDVGLCDRTGRPGGGTRRFYCSTSLSEQSRRHHRRRWRKSFAMAMSCLS
ncbi:hypothetical protein EYF80_046731 [Liparis tanakae]|uniref:Uncharacterized protein n=1 Tax=Liparis tanakae TaxID=230148 RepID=A0A4Z2FPC4_9TELE|nr:hypothetical protein EYF80_046731 [Liparis tanakae]